MSKQIIISSGDFGINFEVQLLDKDKKPVPILLDVVVVNIIYPSGTKRTISTEDVSGVTINDYENGIIEFTLTALDTTELGNYSIYVELEDTSYDISTIAAINYFVIAKNGGIN